MKHFFIQENLLGEKNKIVFSADDFHYLKNVLRMKKGSLFTGVDGKGCLYDLKITEELQGKLVAEYTLLTHTPADELDITLFQVLLKSNKLDMIFRQATEAGIKRIIPVVSEYTVVKIREQDEQLKINRWKRIAREAVQQCGRTSFPEIENPRALSGLKDIEGLKLFFHQEPVAGKSLHHYLATGCEKINILIGPEGGFSNKELPLLHNLGFLPVFLGKTILRAETAALYAIAAVKTILLEKNEWRLN